EALYFFNQKFTNKLNKNLRVSFLIGLEKVLNNRFVSVLLALLGLLSIFTTGLLGGVMVYGISADPLALSVLDLLGLNIY
ncbi:MAG: hypothetical protein AAB873_00415, partial [Patescibacteria group bacterium]